MLSGTPSEVSELSTSDTESFADIHAETLRTSPTLEDASSAMSAPAGDSSSSVDQNPGPCRHPEYYFDDGSTTFLVGGLSYRLHRYLFCRDSPYFANVFARHPSSEPMELADKSSMEFDAFLSVLYSSCFREPQIISVEEWSAVLRLSTEWSFQGIRELAMKRLEPIATPIEKIVLSHSYAIPGWLPEAYTSLCERPHSLIASEIKVVQPEDVELVMSIRETIFRSGRSWERSEIVSRIVEVMRSTSEASAPADESTVSVQQERTPESLKEGAGLAGAADTTAEATNEQELPSDVTLRLDASSFLTLVSANNARDLDYIATQIPRMVKKEVTALLNDLTLDNVASIAGQITRWANLAKDDDDCATLVRVVELVYIKATSNWAYARPCALLCRKITDGISSEIRCDKVRDINGGLIRGGLLFRKYLHDRCQANFKSVCLEGSTDLPRETAVGDLSTMHEHECAVVRFIGELAAAHVLGHAIALDSIERLPPDPEGTTPNEQKVRLVCALLLTAGRRINQAFSFKGRARMNQYLDFINSVDTSKVDAQTAAMIEELLQLQQSGWQISA